MFLFLASSNIITKANAGFTDTAIAGLAAVEDFSAIKLKHSDAETLGYNGEQASPFNELMLIQIKGNTFGLEKKI